MAIDPSGLYPQQRSGGFDLLSLYDAANEKADAYLDELIKKASEIVDESKDAANAVASAGIDYLDSGGSASIGFGDITVGTGWAAWCNANMVITPGSTWTDPATWDVSLDANVGVGPGIGGGGLASFNYGLEPSYQPPVDAAFSLDPNWTAGFFAGDGLGGGASITAQDLTWPTQLSYAGGKVGADEGGGAYFGP